MLAKFVLSYKGISEKGKKLYVLLEDNSKEIRTRNTMLSKMERSTILSKHTVFPSLVFNIFLFPLSFLFCRHSVSLKSLKPLPQASPMEGWNTVPGKKMKKFFPTWGQNAQPGRTIPVFLWRNLCHVFYPKEMKNNKWVMLWFITDADGRGPKNQSKSIKPQSALPPRLQHTVGTRQHQFVCSGPQPHQTSTEQKAPGRNSSQAAR